MTPIIERSFILRSGFGFIGALAVLVALSSITGCSSTSLDEALPDQRLVYKKQRESSENLEIPPDLSAGSFDDAMDIPDGSGEPTTFSEYSGSREHRQQVASRGDVLPAVASVELKRSGKDRWLEVQAIPQAVWPKVVAFWREQGILLVEQDPAVGVMRTDWLDNRAEIRKDFLTRMMSKVVEGAYSTSTRDQYSLRIEEGGRSGTTDVRLSHRGMSERLVTTAIGDGNRTIWEPSGTDTEKEAEMLRRLMVYLGASQQRAAQSVAASGTAAAAPTAPASRLISEGGVPAILIPQEFRNAWRLTGSALDRAGFAVEDRDQITGTYYVRYAGQGGPGGRPGPGGGSSPGDEKPGFASRLAFWRKKEVDPVKQYQIKVAGNGAESKVTVLNAKGQPDRSEGGRRILTLLQQQMR